jgi:hypothetical protein
MNRIILIGNGFDLAHGLKTSYKDFINSYWTEFRSIIYGEEFGYGKICPYNDEFIGFEIKNASGIKMHYGATTEGQQWDEQNSYMDILKYIETISDRLSFYGEEVSSHLTFKNDFFKRISERTGLENWLDIEQEYYDALKELLPIKDPQKRKEGVKKLNEEFCAVKNLLEKYLTYIIENATIEKHKSIQDAFSSLVEFEEIAVRRPKNYTERYSRPIAIITRDELWDLQSETLILNFNYTETAEKLYGKSDYEVISIHGELNNPQNPIIFGYGDELDDDYKKIEKLQDNDFLENIKSIQYHKTRNYRELLKFIESEPYQVFVMGHSCGNSDRTLLNTLFEHENCISLKVFYWQREDGTDDYTNLIRNISRNFNDKQRMRDVVVDYEKCSPLVPVKQ